VSKVAIVIDSNSGVTSKEANALGMHVLLMPFMINEKVFYEEKDLSRESFYEKLVAGDMITTSQPTPEDVMNLWDDLLTRYEEIVHIPMSSGLSGSYQTACVLAQSYDDKVFVVNNQRISVTQKQSALDALYLANEKGMGGKEIKDFLEKDKFNSSIYIMLDTLTYLKRGGRVTAAAAALGNILRIKPVLQIQGEKLDAFAKARTASQGKKIMISAIKNDIENRFGADSEQVNLYIAHTNHAQEAENFRAELEKEFPGHTIEIQDLSLSIGCHIGPGALAVACAKKIEV